VSLNGSAVLKLYTNQCCWALSTMITIITLQSWETGCECAGRMPVFKCPWRAPDITFIETKLPLAPIDEGISFPCEFS
jgi:hypothetical protein